MSADRSRIDRVGLLLLLLSGTTAAIADPPSVPRLATPPVVDGWIDPGEWSRSLRIDSFHQVEPLEFSEPSERTEWFITFDASKLYVAAIAYDREPGLIAAQELRQGASINSDDSLRMLIDPFNTKRSGYLFALNPNGVRFDGIYTSGTQLSSDWDGVWHGAARRIEDGWVMEMQIPFSSLTFDPDNPTWGINLWREIPRKDEVIAWRSRNGEIDPTVSGEITGLKDISQGRGIELVPSLSSSYIRDREDALSERDINPALDIGYKVGNAFNALLTLNTDFAAADVDDRQLGLQRFSLFFPEKRNFFLTDFDIFQFGGVPADGGSDLPGQFSGTNGLAFFSRRIGLNEDNEPVDILFGGKFSGRLGGWDIGTLYMRQDESDGLDETDFVVTRVIRSVLDESTLGAIYTQGDPESNYDNSLLGIDFRYRNTRLGRNRTMTSQFWLQQSNNAGIDDRDRAYSAVISFPARLGFEAGAQYQRVEENFRPPVGFANRTGVELTGLTMAYSWLREGASLVREVDHSIEFERWTFLDSGRVQTQELQADLLTLRTPAGDRIRLSASRDEEGLLPGEQPLDDIGILIPPGQYAFSRRTISIRTAGHRPMSARLDVRDGGFFNGERLSIRPEFEWIPNRHLKFALDYRFDRFSFPGRTAETHQVTLRNAIAFSSRFSLITLAQYDNVSDDLGLNVRFRFNQSAGRDLWLVLNHNWVDGPMGERFRSNVTSAAAKIRFTYRY